MKYEFNYLKALFVRYSFIFAIVFLTPIIIYAINTDAFSWVGLIIGVAGSVLAGVGLAIYDKYHGVPITQLLKGMKK